MKTKLLGFVLFLVVQYNVFGQAAASWNYNTQTGTLGSTYAWIDCTAGTNIVSGDDTQASISWPFNFSFYGNNYTTANSLSVATNGFIRLDGVANGGNYSAASSYDLTSTATTFGQIIAMGIYDDFVGKTTASWVRSLVTGTAPNRIFTIEYNNIEINYNAGLYANIQVSFYESTNIVVLKFGTDNVTQAGADIGIHSGVANYFHKWQEVTSGTNNTWIEYTASNIEVNATIGTLTANYPSLKAAFDKINDGTHKAEITIKIKSSTTEGSSAILNASGTGSSSYSSVYIYPTETGLSINGNLATPLIDLNGASNVTIDGRVNATGTTKDLSIVNSSTSSVAGTSTIRFINGASNNNIKYNTIKGSETLATSGVVFFSTSTAPSGNNTNTLDNNNITNAADVNRPVNAIFSLGTAGKENSGNIISNNNIFDFLKHATASNGIFLSTNTTSFTIDGNSFYETAPFIPTAAVTYNAINIVNTTGNNFTVINNFIGGNAALCGGTPWTKTNASNNVFNAIILNVGTSTVSFVQNNTIQNMHWSNSGNAVWTAIAVAGGAVNIGTTTGNTIGAATGTSAVTVTAATTGLNVYGINITGTGTVDCQNNTIGSITSANGATLASNIYGINKSAVAGNVIISKNKIGSAVTANSINASSTSTANAQLVYGIYNAGTGTIEISNNSISKLNNSTTNTTVGTLGVVNGITSVNGTLTVSNNVIYDLSIANANTNTLNNASVCGIALTGTANAKTVSGNTIYNLSNTYVSFAGHVIGLYFAGGTAANIVSTNFIHSLSVTGASSVAASIYGIKMATGATTYSNNIISLGGNSRTTVYGIYETGAVNNNNNLYFNTIYIDGSLASGTTNKSYALWSNASTNVRNFRNNIFMNARSTEGGASLHYAAYFNYTASTNITLNYNDYFVLGSGGIIGWWNVLNKTVLPIITGQDGNSLAINPNFSAAGGTIASDYVTSASLPGVAITGFATDYNGVTRSDPPKMGALESGTDFIWQGNTSTNFATASNWVNGVVPTDGADISFAATPTNDCYLDQNRILKNITNASAKKFVVNGKQFTLTGAIIAATANQIDASAASSVLLFAGTAAQNIPSSVFVSNTIDGLTLNNSNGLTQNGNIIVQTNLILTNGAYTIGPNTLTLNGSVSTTTGTLTGGSSSNIIVGGSGASTNLPVIALNNLTLNRSNGIGLGGNISVAGTLILTSGTLTVGANTFTISGNAPARTSGNIDVSNAGASLFFTNSAAITLPASVYTGNVNNLTINGAGITAGDNLNVNGILNLQSANPSSIKGSLDMGANTLNMGANATTIGIGDVTGIVKREHTFTGGIEYSFGNQYTSIVFSNVVGGVKPAWISCKIAIGTAPSWRTEAINRIYSFAQDGTGTDRTVTRLHYLDTELHGTETDESKLVFWDAYPGPTFTNTFPRSKSNSNASQNWVELTGMAINFIATSSVLDVKQWGLSYTNVTKKIWTGNGSPTFAGDWSLPGNWNGGVPLATEDVLIPAILPIDTNGYPTRNINSGTVPAVAKTIEIEPGASVTVDNYDITVYGSTGAWINNGTFNAGTGKVIFNHGIPSEIATIAGNTNFYNIEVGPNTTLQPVAGNYLSIAGVGSAYATSIVDFSTVNNTVEWNGVNQMIVNPNGIGGNYGYYNLILSGSGTKTMPTSAMNIANNFILAGTASATAQSALTIGGEMHVEAGTAFITGVFNHSVGSIFDVDGTFTASVGSTITLNGTTIQSIIASVPVVFENLIIANTFAVNIFTDVTVNDVLTLNNGNLNVGTTTLSINGGLVKTSGFIAVNPISSLTFGGTTALTLPSSLFLNPPSINNLTVNRTGGVIAGSDFTINGILNLQSANPSANIGSFDAGSYILTMGGSATNIGVGDVTGKIKRTTILPNIEYSFGNPYTSVTFPNIGTLPTEITLKINIGTVPSWKADGVKRIIDISQIGGSDTKAVLKAHYLDSELNGLDENDLSYFSYIIPSTTLLDRGVTQINTTDNWLTLSNANFGNLPPSFGVIEHGFGVSTSNVITWDGSESIDWFDQYNWTPAFAPSITKIVIIPDAATTPNDPLITASASSTIKNLDIRLGAILNAGAGSQLTLVGTAGAWNNTGAFNASTGKVIFNHGIPSEIATIAGSTNFYNIEVGENTTLQPVAGTILRIAGAGTAAITSVVDFSTVNNTVEWNGIGAVQTIVNPNGITPNSGYFNLIISGSGTKIMPATTMTVNGNFSTSGTATVTADEVLVVLGNTLVGNGSTFETGNFNHLLAGNFENNGTFTGTSGGTITFNGTTSQTISGTSTTSFDNLTIDNLLNVTQTSDINVNNVLLLNGGNLIVGNVTLGINGTISNPSGDIEVSTVSNLSFGGTTALIINNNLFYTTPSLNNLTINRSGGVTLGNQSMGIGGTLALTSGTLTLMANTLTLSGNSPTRISGNIDASNSIAEMAFTNSLAITLPTDFFSGNVANFKVNGSGGVISNGNIALSGILNLESANPSATKGSLDMASTSELSMGAVATTIGIGDVTGIVKREHTFADGIEYSFGHQFTSLNFLGVPSGLKPNWVSCKIEIGTAPVWRTTNVKRIYSFLQAGGTDRTYTKLHYLDSELDALETDESKIIMYTDKDGLSTGDDTVSLGKTSNNITDNWVELVGMAINQIATSSTTFAKEYGLGYTNVSKITWTGLGSASYHGDWSLPGNWLGGVPTATDEVLIPAGLSTEYPYRNLLSSISPANLKSLEIAAGATLSATDYDITVYGYTNAWVNNGSFNAGTAKVIFANGIPANAVSIAGTTNFYDITVNDKTWLQPATGSAIGIKNTINFVAGSILDFTTTNNTIDYNGTNQTVINPGGGTTGYYNLSLSGSGVKTLPLTTFNILGNLSLAGSAVTTTTNDLIVGANLNLSNTSVFTIGAAKTLTVSGAIANTAGSGGLVLQSNVNGTASLIHNTNNVPATVQRYISGAAEAWHFLSTPVSNQTIAGSNFTPSGTYGNGTGYDLYVWDEPTPCWVYQPNVTATPNWPTIHPSANFVPGRGYLYSVQEANPTKEFKGNLNNGIVSYPVTANSTIDPLLIGFNLIGNPYPSSIDWKASAGWTRANLLDSGGGYDMWIWNPAANNYGVYNSVGSVGTNDVTQYIAPMQGFFVRAASNANIAMANGIRLHTGASNWMKSSNTKNKPSNLSVKIASDSGFGIDEVLLQFGYSENEAGAAKLFSTAKTAPSAYLNVGNEDLSVRYLTNTTDNPLVPLKFKPGIDGNYTVKLDFDDRGFDYVMLEDKKTKTLHNLLENPTYKFKGLLTDDVNRFVLHFTPTSEVENELSSNIYYNGNEIVVDLTLIDSKTEVQIVDMLGRLLLNKTVEGNRMQYFSIMKTSQIVIVTAKSENKIKRIKVLIY
ncbi:MAG: hypothetical protein Q8S41_11870 [Lutibacter sp.]|nr:hypothetical protein [Lutibacter sp.]